MKAFPAFNSLVFKAPETNVLCPSAISWDDQNALKENALKEGILLLT